VQTSFSLAPFDAERVRVRGSFLLKPQLPIRSEDFNFKPQQEEIM
jgi:hypothetical protein